MVRRGTGETWANVYARLYGDKDIANDGYLPKLVRRSLRAQLRGVAFFEISKLYPALTMSERALVSEFPWEMTRAYAYSWKAERLCLTIYKGSTANDESDACRHFVWAGLLTSHFGPRFSVTVLDAHEDTLLQSVEEKAMDLANNRAGVLACENLRLISQCNGENLLKTFLDSLVQKRLIVLSPRGKKFK